MRRWFSLVHYLAMALLLEHSIAQADPADVRAEVREVLMRGPLAPVQLDFASFLSTHLSLGMTKADRLFELQQQLQAIEPTSGCEAIELAGLSFDLQLLEERSRLVAAAPPKLGYQGSFIDMNNGRAWYRHWLRSWLLADVSPEQLISIARSELNAAVALRDQQDDQELQVADLPSYRADQHSQIVAGFRERERRVTAHLERVFSPAPDFSPVDISPSNLPKSFPAPGIYDAEAGEFIYHLQGDTLDGSHMDWLYLHEAVPGHHYQQQLASDELACPEATGQLPVMVSTEGWGAYVETLGQELGLLGHPDSRAYVLEWRILRALRVLIDVGLHWQGWSDDDARALWRQYLPGNDFVMEREIARVHRWPVQSITYVYGKHLIEQTLARVSASTAWSPEEIRTQLLRMTFLPPSALDFTEDLMNQKREDDA